MLVLVPVVGVRVVRMRMRHGLVHVAMRVACAGGDRDVVRMPVVLVVLMLMAVFQRFVRVPVLVPFRQV